MMKIAVPVNAAEMLHIVSDIMSEKDRSFLVAEMRSFRREVVERGSERDRLVIESMALPRVFDY